MSLRSSRPVRSGGKSTKFCRCGKQVALNQAYPNGADKCSTCLKKVTTLYGFKTLLIRKLNRRENLARKKAAQLPNGNGKLLLLRQAATYSNAADIVNTTWLEDTDGD